MPRTIVFVTRELFPFNAGGVGRVVANILSATSVAERKQMAVAYLSEGLTAERFRSVYPDVQWIDATPDQYKEIDEQGNRFPPVSAYTDHVLHAESVRIMQVLKRFEQLHGDLCYVEFTDWGGAAFACLQEKKLGVAFKNTCLAVRLHSTDSMLSAMECRHMDDHALALYDLERKALADADVVVAQLPGVAEAVRKFFDLNEAEWAARLRVHAPPVILDNGQPARTTVRPTLDTSIVFSSKIQHFKRPEPFVRACCGFLRDRPDYRGQIFLLAHAFDATYLSSVKALVPHDLQSRFSFVHSANSAERQKIISESVCVFTSAFESFCLAAYEASMSGALCVINENNAGFDGKSPWVNSKNCSKFDGSAIDLTRVLDKIFKEPNAGIRPVEAPNNPSPWRSLQEHKVLIERNPTVSVLITHFNLGAYLEETLDSVLGSDYSNIEVVVVDDASTEPLSCAVIERLSGIKNERLRVIKLTGNIGTAGARNIALQAASGEFVLSLDADDIVHPRFITLAVRGLADNPEYDFVVPQTAYFDAEHPALSAAVPNEFSVVIGEALASGLHRNYFSMESIFARKQVLERLRYNEDLRGEENWELCLRATAAGHRIIATNAIFFFRRDRATKPETITLAALAAARRTRDLQYHDVIRQQHVQVGNRLIPLFAVRSGSPRDADKGETVEALRARLELYESSKTVFAALAIARRLQHSTPWALSLAKGAARFAWRARKRMNKST